MNNKQCVKQEIYLVYCFEGGLDIAAKLLPGHLVTETNYLIFNNVLQISELPPRKKKRKGYDQAEQNIPPSNANLLL